MFHSICGRVERTHLPLCSWTLMKLSFWQYHVTRSPMWQLCICPLVSQSSFLKYILLLLVWPPLTLNCCCSGIQCRTALWNVSLSNCLHCPFFPRPSLLFASQVCKSASSSQSCLPALRFSDLISAGHSLSHTWHELRSTNSPPKAQIIILPYCQEALVHPSESNVEQKSLPTHAIFVSVDVHVHLHLDCECPWGLLVQQKFVSGTLSWSLGEIKIFELWRKRVSFVLSP